MILNVVRSIRHEDYEKAIEIGIVTTYEGQKRKLRRELDLLEKVLFISVKLYQSYSKFS